MNLRKADKLLALNGWEKDRAGKHGIIYRKDGHVIQISTSPRSTRKLAWLEKEIKKFNKE